MFKTKLSTILALVAVLSMLLVPAAYADTGGTTSGSFGAASSTPEVTAVNIYAPSDPTCIGSPITDMTPQTEWYYAKVSVTSNSKLKHLEIVRATLFYNATGSDNMTAPGSGNVHEVARLICTISPGPIYAWTWDFGTSTTWELHEAGCTHPGSLEANSGDWIFAFKPGTVAKENTGAAMWNVQGYAKNRTDGKNDDLYVRNKNMMWYGDITVNTTSVDWGPVPLGLTFGGAENPETGISVTYIANGDYYENVNSSENWTGETSSEIVALDVTGGNPPLADSQFALKGNDTSDNGTYVTVKTSYEHINLLEEMTEEIGNDEPANTLWLSLSEAGITPDIYDGEIHYQIENR